MMWFILCTFYIAMAGGALAIEFLFQAAGWIPKQRNAQIVEAAVTLNYTTVLNIIFIILAVLLLIRFFPNRRSGDAPPHDRHLPQILCMENDVVHPLHFLYRDGRWCSGDRISVSGGRVDSKAANCASRRSRRDPELHHRSEHHFHYSRGSSPDPFFPNRRSGDAPPHEV